MKFLVGGYPALRVLRTVTINIHYFILRLWVQHRDTVAAIAISPLVVANGREGTDIGMNIQVYKVTGVDAGHVRSTFVLRRHHTLLKLINYLIIAHIDTSLAQQLANSLAAIAPIYYIDQIIGEVIDLTVVQSQYEIIG